MRLIADLKEAQIVQSPPPWCAKNHHGASPVALNGYRYERAVDSWLAEQAPKEGYHLVAHPWIEFTDRNGPGWAQPDFILSWSHASHERSVEPASNEVRGRPSDNTDLAPNEVNASHENRAELSSNEVSGRECFSNEVSSKEPPNEVSLKNNSPNEDASHENPYERFEASPKDAPEHENSPPERFVLILECKLSATPVAWTQLESKYRPLVAKLAGYRGARIACVQVCRSLKAAGGVRIVHDLSPLALFGPGSLGPGRRTIYHFLPRPTRKATNGLLDSHRIDNPLFSEIAL